ncbi:hypothetical protein QYE76_034446 [Lolium multiflorum]|uniref:Ribonuclease H1 N-terminal domain-containing protein n=1 Tax=Lolium multiflorum TaxID=4521 RepID=A0AAD8VNB7_LOLMU|nr:hypothetical protein QYE76_034446 [Lolium multiflorum]
MDYFYTLLHSPPKFRALLPVGKQVRGARISGRRRLQRRQRVHLGCFIYFLVQRIFTSGDNGKASLIPIPSQVPDSQPAFDSKVAVAPLLVSDLVAKVAAEVATRLATTKKNKNRKKAERALKIGQKGTGTMKWLPFMSTFMLEKMCGLIQTGVRTDKGFKEVHLTAVAKGPFDHYGVSVCFIQDHPKDAEFLNVPIANYDKMHTIFSFGLATGKYAMGSKSDTVNLDGPREGWRREKVTAGKRKRSAFADDELVAFTNTTVAVNDVAQAIRDNKPTDMHPDLYNAVMDMLGFIEDDLMAALSHLVDHKDQGSSFVGMIEPHRVLWLRNYLGKYHSKWYVVFRGRVQGIYNSWRVCQDQGSGYSNNNYRGYETLEEAQQEYLTFLEEELLEDQAIDEAVPLAQLPPEEVHALHGAPSEVRLSRVKDYIIVLLIVVIVRILFFCVVSDHM